MKLVMAVDTEDDRLTLPSYHQFLPWFLTILHVRQFVNMVHFKVSTLCLTVLALVGFHPLQDAGMSFVEGCRGIVVFVVQRVPGNIFRLEEFVFFGFILNCEVPSAVKHLGNMRIRGSMLSGEGFQEAHPR